jgi:hypothetical protein
MTYDQGNDKPLRKRNKNMRKLMLCVVAVVSTGCPVESTAPEPGEDGEQFFYSITDVVLISNLPEGGSKPCDADTPAQFEVKFDDATASISSWEQASCFPTGDGGVLCERVVLSAWPWEYMTLERIGLWTDGSGWLVQADTNHYCEWNLTGTVASFGRQS